MVKYSPEEQTCNFLSHDEIKYSVILDKISDHNIIEYKLNETLLLAISQLFHLDDFLLRGLQQVFAS